MTTTRLNVLVLRVADRSRRLVWRAFGPRTVGVRGLVVDNDGRVLLVRHTYGRPAWHLPGGGVKRRESLIEGLHRELREEAGVDVSGQPALLGTYSNMREGKSDHISVFVVREWLRHEAHDNEIAETGFFAPDELPDTATPGTRRRLAEWQMGEVSDFAW
jgi:ADP-ribose pyrophosphatase YjhB (NUDIX family)